LVLAVPMANDVSSGADRNVITIQSLTYMLFACRQTGIEKATSAQTRTAKPTTPLLIAEPHIHTL
jgi:hypothetical protein